MQTTKYALVLPKIGAERSLFLGENKVKALAESKTVADFVSQLRDTPYQEQISRLSAPLSGRNLERAFRENLIETYLKITKYAPEQANRYLNVYLSRFESENVKTLIRAAHAKLPSEQRLARLYLQVERYFDNFEVVEEAAKASSIAGVVQAFKGTEYESALNLGFKSFQETGSTTTMDVFVDTLFYEKHFSAYQSLPRREKRHAYFYASIQNDSFILLTLLRGKNLNYDPNWLRLAVPHCFFNLEKKQVESIVSALNFEAAYKIVEDSYYAKYFTRRETPEETIAQAEKAFHTAMLARAKKSRIREIFNIGSTLAFVTLKEAEVYNLTAISLGVDGGMSPEAIKERLLF
ncbi:MAG: V-type ATPase subunit [Candidatus Bathyarchaeota archaeon]|nr:V-type ATPase subunit [Candidatus Bathyarchaeota archaeon]